MKNSKLYSFLKENNENVIMCDRTGNLISVYCKGDAKITFVFPNVSIAQRKYTQFRRDLEGVKVCTS